MTTDAKQAGSAERGVLLPGKLLAFARTHKLFPPGASALCALSGGADSVALLGALRELREALGLRAVAAAHVNHQLRGADADADEAFVRSLCELWGVPVNITRVDVAAEAKRRRAGIEETARALRYDFLRKTAAQAGFSRIVTGHTADDDVETVLLHLVRGAGLSGLTGIPPARESLVRPLLTCTRADVEQYLSARGFSHVEDATNLDVALARNRIRRHVVPELRVLNPCLSDAVSGLTDRLRRDEAYIVSQAEKELAPAVDTAEGVSFPVDRLLSLPPALASRVCRLLYARAAGRDCAASSSHVEAMLSLCAGARPSATLSLPNGFVARRDYGRLVVGPALPPPCLEPFILWHPDAHDDARHLFPLTTDDCQLSVVARPSAGWSEPYRFFLNPDRIQGALTVRARQTGDRLALPGKPGGKSLKRLMIDAKIPARLRDAWPVIVDETGPVAVPGLGVAASHRAPPGAPAIEIAAGFGSLP